MTIRERLRRIDWQSVERSLWDLGYATTPPILSASECRSLTALYGQERNFRKRIDMSRLRFGVGSYAYFRNPLPPLVKELRVHGYRHLAPIANRWLDALGDRRRFPASLASFLRRCAEHGQTKPTPLVLRYEADGFNRLHQDVYGEVAFPLQITCFLSKRETDFRGGEFLLVESEPRVQSRAEVIPGEQGRLVIFPTRERPVQGKRGFRRARMRHGLARVTSGSRYALGIIFHDAQ